MKEYIKKFNDFSSADGYKIKNIPWIGTAVKTGGGGRLNLRCATPDKMLVVSGDTIIKVSTLELTGGTWDGSGSNNETRVFISGDVTLTGKTDCYSLTFEEGGHLTINGGARLRVWEGGITNDDCTMVNYIKIKKDSINLTCGEFLIHPDVNVNNHPYIMIELLSSSWRESSSNAMSEIITIPSYNTIKFIDCHSKHAYIQKYKTDGSGYENIAFTDSNPFPYDKLNGPFWLYVETCYRKQNEPPLTFLIGGNAIGNDDYSISAKLANSVFANSYSARIPTAKLLAFVESYNMLKLSITHENNSVNWIEITQDNIKQYPYVECMRGFMFNIQYSTSITLSYKDLVWDPSFEEEVTPTRILMKGTLTASKPSGVDTTLEGSRVFDNPEPPFTPEHDER